MIRRAVVALGILAVLSLATTASAQPGNMPPGGTVPPPSTYAPPPPFAPAPATRTDRYGTSVAAMDALAAGLIFIGAIVVVAQTLDDDSSDEGAASIGVIMMFGGVGVYAFGPAYIHTRHKNNSGAWKSVGLRLGLPLLGGLLGSGGCLDYGQCNEEDNSGSLFGLGVLAAMVIDWAWLAKVEVPVAPAPYYPYAAPMAGGGGSFGIAGAF